VDIRILYADLLACEFSFKKQLITHPHLRRMVTPLRSPRTVYCCAVCVVISIHYTVNLRLEGRLVIICCVWWYTQTLYSNAYGCICTSSTPYKSSFRMVGVFPIFCGVLGYLICSLFDSTNGYVVIFREIYSERRY
jgi:hypothetical protein